MVEDTQVKGKKAKFTEIENEKIVAKMVEYANERNLDRMMESFSEDVSAQWPYAMEKWAKKDIRAIFERSFKIWSNGVYRIIRLVSSGGTVVAQVHWAGVQTGDWPRYGIPATGRRVELVEVWIMELVGGRVRVYEVFYNPDLVVQQLRN